MITLPLVAVFLPPRQETLHITVPWNGIDETPISVYTKILLFPVTSLKTIHYKSVHTYISTINSLPLLKSLRLMIQSDRSLRGRGREREREWEREREIYVVSVTEIRRNVTSFPEFCLIFASFPLSSPPFLSFFLLSIHISSPTNHTHSLITQRCIWRLPTCFLPFGVTTPSHTS